MIFEVLEKYLRENSCFSWLGHSWYLQATLELPCLQTWRAVRFPEASTLSLVLSAFEISYQHGADKPEKLKSRSETLSLEPSTEALKPSTTTLNLTPKPCNSPKPRTSKAQSPRSPSVAPKTEGSGRFEPEGCSGSNVAAGLKI